MTTEATVLLQAAFSSYPESVAPTGYWHDKEIISNASGLHMEIYRRAGTNNYIVSFRGTEPTQLSDLAADANLGWPQYQSARDDIQRILKTLIEEGGNVEVTGHSLGGALAQFAVYDFLESADGDKRKQLIHQVSLTTWNALGGVWGLERNGGYNLNVMDGINARHYFRADDIVSRLGNGHVGGEMLRLEDPEGKIAGVLGAHMQAELSQSLQASSITAGRPAYFHFSDESQRVIGDLLMGAYKLNQEDSKLGGISLILSAKFQAATVAKVHLAKDLGLLAGTILIQEAFVILRDYGPEALTLLKEQIRTAVLGPLLSSEAVQDLVLGMLTALRHEWPRLQQAGQQLANDILDGFLELGKALITSWTAGAELQAWGVQQQLLLGTESISGVRLAESYLPGRPDLIAYEPVLNARLGRVRPFRCPLVLDLGGDGLTTLALNSSGVRFDLNADGVREACGWIGPGEALLVRDRNRDGRIDSGQELFGDHTPLASGAVAAHGFEALSELDSNRDGQIDATDAAWGELGLWRDADSDGVLDAGEWLNLAAADVAALELTFSHGTGPDAQGNELRLAGHYRRANGERRLMADVWLASEASQAVMATPLYTASTTSGISAPGQPAALGDLPDIRGIGRVPGLMDSLLADSSGRLRERLQTWLVSDAVSRQKLMPEILYLWTGVADLPAKPIGGLADQRVLATLHALSNDRFTAVQWEYTSPTNLELLRNSFEDLCRWVGNLLSSREHLSPLWSRAIRVGTDGRPSVDGPSLDLALEDQLNRATSDEQLIAAGQALRSHSLVSGALLNALRERAMDQLSQPDRRLWLLILPRLRQPSPWSDWNWSQPDAELIELMPGDDSLDAGGGDDVLIGTSGADRPRGGDGNDLILSGDGDDSIETSAGNDTICAGRGNDSIAVGRGQGLIVFNPGDGQDRITTTKLDPTDPAARLSFTLHFNGELNAETIRIRRLQQDLTITFLASSDQLFLADYFPEPVPWDPGPKVNTLNSIQFADGRRWDFRQLMQRAVEGTSGNDELQGCELDETINGGSGDDNLHGWGGCDLLNGDSGSDTLQGSSGNNTLRGGSGNDSFVLSGGSNQVIYNPGDGSDTVHGNSRSAHNELILGAGISPQDLKMTRSGNDLLLAFPHPDDSIRLSSFFYKNWCYEEEAPIRFIRFHDGLNWSWQAIKDTLLRGNDADNQIIGFSNSDTLSGEGGHDVLIGREGNDLLLGGPGNDTLTGDAGSDRLEGGEGNDVLACGTVGGEDTLLGGAGNNIYTYQRGDVVILANPETITPGVNSLNLHTVAVENTTLARQGNTLVLTVTGTGVPGSSTIKVEDFFREFTVLNRWNPVQTISFSSGTRWDARTVASKFSNAVMGSSSDNKLSGRDSDDWLDGMEGNDLLQGLAGHDTLQGGSGNDTLVGGAGNDLLLGSDGQDTASWAGTTTPVRVDLSLSGPQETGHGLDLLSGIEHLLGGSGNDRLLGDDAANRLDGGDGDDTLDGGGGNDTLLGGNHLSGGDTASYARAGAAVTVNLALTTVQNTGGGGSDQLNGIEHLIGSRQGDSLIGSSAANRLDGGDGNDTLQGGTGADTLVGGEGADCFQVSSPAEAGNGSGSRDWILDFSAADRLDLSAIDARSDVAGNQAFIWIGTAAFSGLGQLRYTRLSNGNGLLEGNCSGSLAADLQLELSGAPDLAGGALVLL